jgi:hypothetical protein
MSSPICFNELSCAFASYYTTAIWPLIGAPLLAHAAIGAHHVQQLASAAYTHLQKAVNVWNTLDIDAQNASIAAGAMLSTVLFYQLFLYIAPVPTPTTKVQPAISVEDQTLSIRRSTRTTKAPERWTPPTPPDRKRKRKTTPPTGGRAVKLTCGSRNIYHVVWDSAGQPTVNRAFYNARTGFVEPDGAAQMTLRSFVQKHSKPDAKPVKQFDNLYLKTREALVPLLSFKV